MMEKTFKIIQTLHNLKAIKRTGPNLFAGIAPSELQSIADHSFTVVNLVLLISTHYKDEIDELKLLKHAITHDWAESIIGDLPTGSPSYNKFFKENIRNIFKNAESQIKSELLKDGDIELKGLTELELQILKLADKTALIIELADLKQNGHTHQWIVKMFNVQMMLIKKMELKIVSELAGELEILFENGMDNYYLTRATNK